MRCPSNTVAHWASVTQNHEIHDREDKALQTLLQQCWQTGNMEFIKAASLGTFNPEELRFKPQQCEVSDV